MKFFRLFLMASPMVCLATSISIDNVTAQQRYPGNGKVDISYKVTGDIAGYALTNGLITTLKVTATDKVANTSYTATTESLSGATSLTEGSHAIVWDLDRQGVNLMSSNVVFDVSCETNAALYCVIDLSAGAEATSYPVTYLAAEPSGGFTNDTYRTTKLALRRCNAGSFKSYATKTLTKPFYMGVFEVTQKQWMLVMGTDPCSSTSDGKGDGHPVHYVTYDMIRGSSNGAKWPSSTAVDETSFLGKLQARTKLNFDLPTDAQWEYACRAGVGVKWDTYYWGYSLDGDYLWYSSNSGAKCHPVGMKKPNDWGLYDMIGNVEEWCLDKHSFSADVGGVDPQGPSSGSLRVVRGGSWMTRGPDVPRTSDRDYGYPSSINLSRDTGFRLSRTLTSSDLMSGTTVASAASQCDGNSRDVPAVAVARTAPPLYLVVDLSGGTSAANYPVSYLSNAPASGWTDEYKTTKLVLRRIEAGTFTMGSPLDEVGRSKDETSHTVTLTKDFHIGVFEVTQRQWELVMGSNPSSSKGNTRKGSTRPAESISYNMARGASMGAGWPKSSDVDATSFFGRLRARTGLDTFDLPTEAQWEYACRAGTTTALNSGKNLVSTGQDPAMDIVGRYGYNNGYKGGSLDGKGGYCEHHTTVGLYNPNAWGLYDMHGNVQEWCLDWYRREVNASNGKRPMRITGSASGLRQRVSSVDTDPVGARSSGGGRVLRGGSWFDRAQGCRSASRYFSPPSDGDYSCGFRACLH